GVFAYTIPGNINLSNRYNTPGNFEYFHYPLIQLFYEHKFSDNWKFRQNAGEQYIDDEYWQSEGLQVDPETLKVLRGNSGDFSFNLYFHHLSHFVQSQSDIVGEFKWGKIKHQVVAGYEFDILLHRTKRSSGAQNTDAPDIDYFNPVETGTKVTFFPPSRFDG